MTSGDDVFRHAHRDGVRDLKLEKAVNDNEKAALSVNNAHDAHGVILDEYGKMLESVIKTLDVPTVDAESIVRAGLKALDEIEQFRWLLENLIEAVKRDDSLQNSLTRYAELGLLARRTTEMAEEKRQSPWLSNAGSGLVMRKVWKGLRKTALIVMEILLNAIKVLPKLVSIKPKPSIGLTGLFPTFSLSFDLEAESITLDELFETLKGSA